MLFGSAFANVVASAMQIQGYCGWARKHLAVACSGKSLPRECGDMACMAIPATGIGLPCVIAVTILATVNIIGTAGEAFLFVLGGIDLISS